MKRLSQNFSSSAYTLPEILVGLFLVSIVLAALGGLLRGAIRFYTDQSATLEVQKNCVLALRRIGRDLRETSSDSIDATTANELIFASPRDINGVVEYTDGRLMWQKYIKFSIQNINGLSVLTRQEDALDRPTSIPPPTRFSDFAVPDSRAVQAHFLDTLKVKIDGGKAEVEVRAKYHDIFEMSLKTEVKLQN